MNHIPTAAVVEAFQRIRKRPVRGCFITEDHLGCCGLTAILLDRELATIDGIEGMTDDADFLVAEMIAQVLELDPYYTYGFIKGWDGAKAWDLEASSKNLPAFEAGIGDGAAAHGAVVDYLDTETSP